MKSTSILGILAVVVGLVFGITFLATYSGSSKQVREGPGKNAIELKTPEFPITTVSHKDLLGTEKSWIRPFLSHLRKDYEEGEYGAFDFWFTNRNEIPILLGVHDKNCVCESIALTRVPEDVMKQYLEETAICGFISGSSNQPLAGLIAQTASTHRFQNALSWKSLDKGGEPLEVPKAPSESDPAIGIVRIYWKPKPSGTGGTESRITAQLRYSTKDIPPALTAPLTIDYNSVPPLFVSTDSIRFPEMNQGSKPYSEEFLVWSATRSGLNVSLQLRDIQSSCFEFEQPVKLNEQELQDLERDRLRVAKQAPAMKCAYRIKATLFERRDNQQLDLGAFNHQLILKLGEKEVNSVRVRGVIRGDVRIRSSGDSQDEISLGRFPAKRDLNQAVIFVSNRKDLELSFSPECRKQSKPDSLNIDLGPKVIEDNQAAWKLRLTVPAYSLQGEIPPGDAIYLEVKYPDKSSRMLRIPITGTGFAS